MKYLQRLGVILAVVGFFYSPYYCVRKFARALDQKDWNAVGNMMDPNALKKSMKELIVDAAVEIRMMSAPAGAGINRQLVRETIINTLERGDVERMLDNYLSAENLTGMLTAGAGNNGQFAVVWRNEKWNYPWEFSVQDPQSTTRLKFQFRGYKWVLTGIDVPRAELQRFLQGRV